MRWRRSLTNTVNPASYPDEVAFLPAVIGNFTNAIMSFVRTSQPTCRFEVLYPIDVNQTHASIRRSIIRRRRGRRRR